MQKAKQHAMPRATRPIWIILALAFLVEAWLWETLSPIVGRLLSRLPIESVKLWARESIQTLPPAAAVLAFAVPAILLLPLKFVGLWLLMRHHWLAAICLIGFAKAAGVAVTAFIFDVTKPKLLQIAWFRTVYNAILRCYNRAHRVADPYLTEIRRRLALLRTATRGPMARIRRMRRRIMAVQGSRLVG
jgi:hypothetical protein